QVDGRSAQRQPERRRGERLSGSESERPGSAQLSDQGQQSARVIARRRVALRREADRQRVSDLPGPQGGAQGRDGSSSENSRHRSAGVQRRAEAARARPHCDRAASGLLTDGERRTGNGGRGTAEQRRSPFAAVDCHIGHCAVEETTTKGTTKKKEWDGSNGFNGKKKESVAVRRIRPIGSLWQFRRPPRRTASALLIVTS